VAPYFGPGPFLCKSIRMSTLALAGLVPEGALPNEFVPALAGLTRLSKGQAGPGSADFY